MARGALPTPPLLPADPEARQRVRALAAIVGCDIHPVNNRRILETLRRDFGADDAAINRWCGRWIADGFDAIEAMLAADAQRREFCVGDAPTAMPLSEVAPSLTTKLLDAVDIDLDALVGLKFYQQAPNLTLTNHMAFPGVIAVSKKWWDARTDAERETIRKVVADAETWGVQVAIDAEASNLKKAQADGTKVIGFDAKSFQQVAAPVRDKQVGKNPLIADFYKTAKDL